jgi:protease-4
MSMKADDLIDRRRLRRKLTFWRVVAFLIAAFAVVGMSTWLAGERIPGVTASHIAKIRIEGTITEDEDLLRRLDEVRKSASVKGVILSIDSPGGTTAGGEAIYDAVRKIAAEKPVVAQVGTLAASAGYMIASASDHIVARKSSIVGSIGVLVQFPDLTGLMDKLGVKLEEIKSSPLKAEPNPFNPTTDEERAMMRNMILDSYDWFVGIVAERRLGMDRTPGTRQQAYRRGRRRGPGDRLARHQGRRRQARGHRMEAGPHRQLPPAKLDCPGPWPRTRHGRRLVGIAQGNRRRPLVP